MSSGKESESSPCSSSSGTPRIRTRHHDNSQRKNRASRKRSENVERIQEAVSKAQAVADVRLSQVLSRTDELEKQLRRVKEKTRSNPVPNGLTFSYVCGGISLKLVLAAIFAAIVMLSIGANVILLPFHYVLYGHVWIWLLIALDNMLMLYVAYMIFSLIAKRASWLTIIALPARVSWVCGTTSRLHEQNDVRPPAMSCVDMVYSDPQIITCRRTYVPAWAQLLSILGPDWSKRFHRVHDIELSWTIYCVLRTHVLADLSLSDIEAEHNINVAVKRLAYVNTDPAILAHINYHFDTVRFLVERLRAERQKTVEKFGGF